MTATIRVGYAGPLVTGVIPTVAINAPVTVTSRVAATASAAISAPVSVGAPGLGPQIRVAYAGPLLTDAPYTSTIQAPVTISGAISGGPSGGIIRVAYAGPLFTVQDTHYWSGTAWVDGTAAAFITAPVNVAAAGITPAPSGAIRAPVSVAAGVGTTGVQRDITVTFALEPDAYTLTIEDGPYTFTLEDTMPRLIRTSIGDTGYVSGLFNEIFGKDISASTFQISLGTPNAPGTWLAPTIVEPVTVSQMRLKLLVGSGGTTVSSGSYRVWGRIIDSPETESLLAVNDRVTIA